MMKKKCKDDPKCFERILKEALTAMHKGIRKEFKKTKEIKLRK